MNHALKLLLCFALAGCGTPPESADAGPPTADAGPRADGGAPADGATGDDAGATPACSETRVRETLAIPTQDGYELNGWLDRPDDDACPLPTILLQTPYDAEGAYTLFFGADRSSRPLFDSDAYNYVTVDWRGRFGSSEVPDGDQGPRQAQDAYDIVEWIAAQPWSDGQVGTWGVSALCRRQYITASGPVASATFPDLADEPPPHLSAMVPIFCPARESYESTYFGGVLRHERVQSLDVLGYGVRRIYESNPRQNFLWDIAEASVPFERVEVPALVVGGFYDLDPRTTIDAFRELVAESDPSVRGSHRLLIGNWTHFATGGEASSGALRPLSAEERAFLDLERRIDADSLAFFDHHLRGIDNDVGAWSPVRYHHTNVGWADADAWPPAGAPARTLYLHADGALNDTAPSAGTLSFDHDPADPSPTIGGATLSPYNCLASSEPVLCALGMTSAEPLFHGPTSQAPVVSRSDQLTFQTEPLTEPLRLLGEVRVQVDVSTTGADGDVAVRLVDIDEAGEPLLIGEGIRRISARSSFRTPDAVTPGTRYSVEVELLADVARDLEVGHRLGVIVSAANWPQFARNPNDGAVFYRGDTTSGTPASLIGDGRPATHTLHLDGATRLLLNGG